MDSRSDSLTEVTEAKLLESDSLLYLLVLCTVESLVDALVDTSKEADSTMLSLALTDSLVLWLRLSTSDALSLSTLLAESLVLCAEVLVESAMLWAVVLFCDTVLRLVLALSLAIGIGVELVPDALKLLPDALKQVFSNGIIIGGLVAIVANLVIPEKE